MITIHGIKNCDTCRKARKWLEAEGLENRFHDIRADGLDGTMLDAWISALGWEALLNRRSTTWRKLNEVDRDGIECTRAAQLMLEHPTLIKRPVFEVSGRHMVGFGEAERVVLAGAG